MNESKRHDFIPYLESMTMELASIRDRVRHLVRHWPTDGHFKEAILRQVLRRHLPECVTVGTGFVVNFFGPSGEVDILVTDTKMPTLFRDGELLIVTPESVLALIEVKTSLRGRADIVEAMVSLAERKAVVTRHPQCKDVWAGLFVYDGKDDYDETILDCLNQARAQTGEVVNVVCFGESTIAKYFSAQPGKDAPKPAPAWHSFHIPNVAPSSFVASLIEHLVPEGRDPGVFAWFHPPDGFDRRFVMESRRDARPMAYAKWIEPKPETE